MVVTLTAEEMGFTAPLPITPSHLKRLNNITRRCFTEDDNDCTVFTTVAAQLTHLSEIYTHQSGQSRYKGNSPTSAQFHTIRNKNYSIVVSDSLDNAKLACITKAKPSHRGRPSQKLVKLPGSPIVHVTIPSIGTAEWFTVDVSDPSGFGELHDALCIHHSPHFPPTDGSHTNPPDSVPITVPEPPQKLPTILEEDEEDLEIVQGSTGIPFSRHMTAVGYKTCRRFAPVDLSAFPNIELKESRPLVPKYYYVDHVHQQVKLQNGHCLFDAMAKATHKNVVEIIDIMLACPDHVDKKEWNDYLTNGIYDSTAGDCAIAVLAERLHVRILLYMDYAKATEFSISINDKDYQNTVTIGYQDDHYVVLRVGLHLYALPSDSVKITDSQELEHQIPVIPHGDSDIVPLYRPEASPKPAAIKDTLVGGNTLSKIANAVEKSLQSFLGSNIDTIKITHLVAAAVSVASSVVGIITNIIAAPSGWLAKFNITLWAINLVASFVSLLITVGIWRRVDKARENLMVQSIMNYFTAYTNETEESVQGNDQDSKVVTTICKIALMLGIGTLGITAPSATKKIHSIVQTNSDIATLISTFSETLFDLTGYDVQGTHQYQRYVDELQAKAVTILAKSMDLTTKSEIDNVEALINEINVVINRANRSEKIVLLSGVHSDLIKHLVSLKAAYTNKRPTPCPLGFYWSGAPGIGKSEYVKVYLTQYLNKRYNLTQEEGQVYSLRVGAGKQFPDYMGNKWAVYDEFGNDKDATGIAIGGILNEIMTVGGGIIQGASLAAKNQRSAFHGVHFISNLDPATVDIGLKPEAKAAFLSRLCRIRVVDPQYKSEYGRVKQSHRKADFSHLIFHLKMPGSNVEKVYTAKDLIGYIDTSVFENIQNFITTSKDRNTVLHDVKPRVGTGGLPYNIAEELERDIVQGKTRKLISISGAPDIGKTYDWLQQGSTYAQVIHKDYIHVVFGNDMPIMAKDTVYVFDDYFDFKTEEGQKDLAKLYDTLPEGSIIVVISNFLPSDWNPRSLMFSGCTKVTQLRDGFYRRMGWTSNALDSRAFRKVRDTYYRLTDAQPLQFKDIISYLYSTSAEAHVHIGQWPTVVTVTPENSDMYISLKTRPKVTKTELMGILRTGCSSVALSAFIMRHALEVDVDSDDVTNITRFVTRYYDEVKHFKFLAQSGERTCLLQDGEFYVNTNNLSHSIHRGAENPEALYYCHDGIQTPVDVAEFRKFRNGLKPAPEKVATHLRYAQYKREDPASYIILNSIPFTWTEMCQIAYHRVEAGLTGLNKFINENKILLLSLSAFALAAYLISKICKIESNVTTIEQEHRLALRQTIAIHNHLNKIQEWHEVTAYYAEVEWRRKTPENDDWGQYMCFPFIETHQSFPEYNISHGMYGATGPNGVDYALYPGLEHVQGRMGGAGKGKNKGGSYKRKEGRRRVWINGRWWYDDEAEFQEDEDIQSLFKAGGMAIRGTGGHFDGFGNAIVGFSHKGKSYRASVRPDQSSIMILEDNEWVQGRAQIPDKAYDIMRQNVWNLGCGHCVAGAQAVMLTDNIGISPLHLWCAHESMYVSQTAFTKYPVKIITKDPVLELALFSVLSADGKKSGHLPGVPSIIGHVVQPGQARNFRKASVAVKNPKGVEWYTGDYVFHDTLTSKFSSPNIASWRAKAGVLTIAHHITHGRKGFSGVTDVGDCGIPYFGFDEAGKPWLLGFHTMYKEKSQTLWGTVLHSDWLAEALRLEDHGEAQAREHHSLNYVPVDDLFPYGTGVAMESRVASLMQPPTVEDQSLEPFGPALRKIATIKNKIPYDPPTKRNLILPAIDISAFGPANVPALQRHEILEKDPSLIPFDKNGHQHVPYIRLIKGEQNLSANNGAFESRFFQAAQRLADHDKIKYGIRTLVPLTPQSILNGRKGQDKMKIKGKSMGALGQLLFGRGMKSDYFIEKEEGTIDFHPAEHGQWLKQAVRDQHFRAINGMRTSYPSHSTLKPELLVPGKEHKRRVVQNSFLPTVINMKRYCQPLASAFNAQGPLTPYALALAPHTEWHGLMNDLLAHGTEFMDLDFSSFDITVPDLAIKASMAYVAQFFSGRDDFDAIATACSVYAENICYDPIFIGDALISKEGGVASGIESTSFIDSIAARITFYLVHSFIKAQYDPFFDLMQVEEHFSVVKTKSCGDDFLVVFKHGSFIPYSNIKRGYSELFGMVTTNGAKTGDSEDKPATVEQVSFCSRKAVEAGDSGFYISKLKPNAVASIFKYSSAADPETQYDQCEAGLVEVVPYGKKIYDVVASGVERFARVHGIPSEVVTYETYLADSIEGIKSSISIYCPGVQSARQQEIEYTLPSYALAYQIVIPDDSKLNRYHSLVSTSTIPSTMDLAVTTSKQLMRKCALYRQTDGPRPLSDYYEIPGSAEVLSHPGKNQKVTINKVTYTIPIKHSISVLQYLQGEGEYDVQTVAVLNTSRLSESKREVVRFCATLEDLRRTGDSAIPTGPEFRRCFSTADFGTSQGETPGAPASSEPSNASTAAPHMAPPDAVSSVPAAPAPSNAEKEIQYEGTPDRVGTLAFQNLGGILTDPDLLQCSVIENVLSFAYKKQLTETRLINTETDSGYVIDRFAVNPWSRSCVHADTLRWANGHKRFIGSFEISYELTSTAGLYGSLQAVFIPPQYAGMAIDERTLSRFTTIELSASEGGRVTFLLTPVNPTNNKVLFIEKDDGGSYGELVLYTATRLANLYGTTVPITLRKYVALAENAKYFNVDFDDNCSGGGGGGGPPTPGPNTPPLFAFRANNTIIWDGSFATGYFHVDDTVQKIARTYPEFEIQTHNHGAFFATRGYFPEREAKAADGDGPPQCSWAASRFDTPVNKVITYLYPKNHNAAYSNYFIPMGPILEIQESGVNVGRAKDDRMNESMEWENYFIEADVNLHYVEIKHSADHSPKHGQTNPGGSGIANAHSFPKKTSSLSLSINRDYLHQNATELRWPHMAYRGPMHFPRASQSPKDTNSILFPEVYDSSWLPAARAKIYSKGLYCSKGAAGVKVTGQPQKYRSVLFVDAGALIPAVQKAVVGYTMFPGEVFFSCMLAAKKYFEANSEVKSYTISLKEQNGTQAGVYLVNKHGIWIFPEDGEQHGAVAADPFGCIQTIQNVDITNEWPTLAVIQPRNYTSRVINNSNFLARDSGSHWNTTRPEDLALEDEPPEGGCRPRDYGHAHGLPAEGDPGGLIRGKREADMKDASTQCNLPFKKRKIHSSEKVVYSIFDPAFRRMLANAAYGLPDNGPRPTNLRTADNGVVSDIVECMFLKQQDKSTQKDMEVDNTADPVPMETDEPVQATRPATLDIPKDYGQSQASTAAIVGADMVGGLLAGLGGGMGRAADFERTKKMAAIIFGYNQSLLQQKGEIQQGLVKARIGGQASSIHADMQRKNGISNYSADQVKKEATLWDTHIDPVPGGSGTTPKGKGKSSLNQKAKNSTPTVASVGTDTIKPTSTKGTGTTIGQPVSRGVQTTLGNTVDNAPRTHGQQKNITDSLAGASPGATFPPAHSFQLGGRSNASQLRKRRVTKVGDYMPLTSYDRTDFYQE